MPRWEPGTRDRLERAALALFAERGYAAVTVPDIAQRAGVTKATFFRVFPDKREVLFWGQSLLADLFADGIAAAPPDAGVRDLLHAALAAVAAAFPDERHDLAATRRAVVAGEAELRERLAAKRAALRDAIAAALRMRGVPADEALLAAEVGRLAYSEAYATWAAAPPPGDFAGAASAALDRLLAAAGRLGAA